MKRAVLPWLVLAGAPLATGAAEQMFAGWDIRGSNTLRLDQFEVSGPPGTSPYPFEGSQAYNEFGLDFTRRDRQYAKWNAQLFGVLNANRYRSPEDALVPERMNLTREVGDGSIPYRWELGDHFSYLSYMTQQRSLKGLQVELQPGTGGLDDSLLLFAGSNESTWQDFSTSNDSSVGASYLIDRSRLGSWSFNVVYNHRDNDFAAGLVSRDQIVASAAMERDFELGDNRLTLEGEYGLFGGDHNGTGAAGSGRDRFGQGYYLELRGYHRTLPLDYRLRGERYDEDFRPRGAVITPDRRSAEAHAGWRFGSGLQLRGRLQLFDTAFQSSNEFETRTAGLNLSGPFLDAYIDGMNGVVDVYYQTRENELDTIDQDFLSVSANVSAPIGGGWFGRLGLLLQDTDDDNAPAPATGARADQTLWQLDLAADRGFQVGELYVFVTPGMLVRLLRQNAPESDEFQPTLAMRVDGGPHSFGLNYGVLVQDRLGLGITDVDTHRLSTDYRYQRGRHTLGAELAYFDRAPQPGADTSAWNLGLYWNYQFDRPAAPLTVAGAPRAAATPAAAHLDGVDLAAIAPGADLAQTRKELGAFGVAGATRIGPYEVYEHQVLRGIFQRQRLVLGEVGGAIGTAALIVGFDGIGEVDTIEQTFERVRKALIDRYGAPDRALEEGQFGPQLIADVNAQRFIRVMEWDTGAGVLRFGIPRRLDGQVRMEIQHRPAFPALRDTRWSLEEVR